MVTCQNNINKAGVKDELKLAKKTLSMSNAFWLCSGQEEQERLDPWLEPDGAELACDKEEGKQSFSLLAFVIFIRKNDFPTVKKKT